MKPASGRDRADAVGDSLNAVDDSLHAVGDSLSAVDDSLNAVDDSLEAVDHESRAVEDSRRAVDDESPAFEDSLYAVDDGRTAVTGMSDAVTDTSQRADDSRGAVLDMSCAVEDSTSAVVDRHRSVDDSLGAVVDRAAPVADSSNAVVDSVRSAPDSPGADFNGLHSADDAPEAVEDPVRAGAVSPKAVTDFARLAVGRPGRALDLSPASDDREGAGGGSARPEAVRAGARGNGRWRRGHLLGAVALLGLAACKGPQVQNVPPSIELQNSAGGALKALVFPVIAFGTTETQSFQVTSVAPVDAHVSFALSGPEASLFTVTPAATSAVTVPASGSSSFTVTFAPTLPSPIPPGNVSDTATLTVTSDDPQHPTIPVPIAALAAAQELDLCWAPTSTSQACVSDGGVTVPFGTIAYRGSATPQEIDVVNRSDVPLTVKSLALDAAALDAGFSIVENITTPFVLSAASGEAEVLHVTLSPRESGPLSGNFLVTSDDPRLGGSPEAIQLTATGEPPGAPTACLGIYQITYADGTTVDPDPTRPLSAQPGVVSPGPLDTAWFTAEPSSTCSLDPQDGQAMSYQFALATPPGSAAALAKVSGHPEEQSVLFDVPGIYTLSLVATDSAGLTATAQVQLVVRPHDDLSFELSWQSLMPVDLDLHLVRIVNPDAGVNPLTQVGAPSLSPGPNAVNDCYYADCLPAFDYPPGSSLFVDWGAPDTAGVRDRDDPLLAAQFGFAPLNSEAYDVAGLSGPQPGADYDVFALYYRPPQGGQPGVTCRTSSDCTDAGFPVCVNLGASGGDAGSGECVPAAQATLRTFVGGNELDGGSPVSFTVPATCDLWWAGTLHWYASGVALSDGGQIPPVFSFTPHLDPDGGWLSVNGTPGQSGACVPP